MYNRYIPDGDSYTRIPMEDLPPLPEDSEEKGQPLPPGAADPPKKGEKKGLLSGLFKGLKLEGLDAGDILLLLIILFLFLEGDDMELIITLGLLLILGLD